MEFDKSKAAISVGSLKKLPGAINALIKARGEPGWPIGAIEQITEDRYVQAKWPESSEDFDFLGISALKAQDPFR